MELCHVYHKQLWYYIALGYLTLHLPFFKTQFYNRIMITFDFDCPPFSFIDITMSMGMDNENNRTYYIQGQSKQVTAMST